MPARLRSLIAACLLLSGVTFALPAKACAAPASAPVLKGLHPQSQLTFFAETEPTGTDEFDFQIEKAPDGCPGTVAVRWRVVPNTAEAAEIESDTGVIEFTDDGESDPIVPVAVSLYSDSETEVVEYGDVSLENESGAIPGFPSRAPVYIIDDDGPSRISFGKVSFSHVESSTTFSIVIPVFRSGPASTTVSVPYTVGGGSSSAESNDHTGASGTLNFAAGDRVEVISFTTKDDAQNEDDETVVVDLGGPGLGSPTSATVTIVDNDTGETVPPSTRFHHPKHKVTYDEDFWKVFEYHVYAKDNDGGTGLDNVQMALKKKLRSGGCKWWNKVDWVTGSCHQLTWVDMKFNLRLYPPKDNGELLHFVRNPDGLVPSMGTKVEDYTIYSRARDLGGNTEEGFEIGRNKNVFEVRPVG